MRAHLRMVCLHPELRSDPMEATAVYLLLCCSVLVFSARAAERVATKYGTVPQNLGGRNVLEDSLFGKETPETTPSAGADEEGHPSKSRRRRRRSLLALSRSKPSSADLFSKRLGTGSKLLLTTSAIVALVIMLRRLRDSLRTCLAEVGTGGLKPGGGPPARSLSDPRSKEMCDELLRGALPRGKGNDGAAPDGRSFARLAPAARGLSSTVLTMVLLFAIIATALAAPASMDSQKRREKTWASGPQAEEEETELTKDFYGPSGGPLPVKVSGDKVTVGRHWKDSDGRPKHGSWRAIRFDYKGKKYRVLLSHITEQLLWNQGHFRTVYYWLSKAPQIVDGKIIWGPKNDRDAVRTMAGNLALGDRNVTFELYLPKGALGILQEDDKIMTREEREAWRDLHLEVRTVLHVMMTGKVPEGDSWISVPEKARGGSGA